MEDMMISRLYVLAFLLETAAAFMGLALVSKSRANQSSRLIVYGIATLASGRFYEMLLFLALGITRNGFCLADMGVFGMYLFFCSCFMGQKSSGDVIHNYLKPVTLLRCLIAAIPVITIALNVTQMMVSNCTAWVKFSALGISIPAAYLSFFACLSALRSNDKLSRSIHRRGLALCLVTQLACISALRFGHDWVSYVLYAADGFLCVFLIIAIRRALDTHE